VAATVVILTEVVKLADGRLAAHHTAYATAAVLDMTRMLLAPVIGFNPGPSGESLNPSLPILHLVRRN